MSQSSARLAERLIVKPGSKVHLHEADAGETHGYTKESAAAPTARDLARLTALQEPLYAEQKHHVLVVLQGIDSSGKDGTIRHVMSALNPQGCRVAGFDVPTAVESAHDYLWRVHAQTPAKGEIVVFNRSHYEDVLVVRVHDLVPADQWGRRFDQINAFEDLLTAEGTTIVKFFLHIDADEQRQRLQARYDDPSKHWKFKMSDLEERKRWADYMTAYGDVLSRCSTESSPWYVVPANRKWFRNLAIGEILADRIEALKPQYPVVGLPPNLVIS